MPAFPTTPRRPRDQDVRALIGLLAVLEGEVLVTQLDDLEPLEWMDRVAERLTRDGLLAARAGMAELANGLGDLNQRLRHVLGESDAPGEPD